MASHHDDLEVTAGDDWVIAGTLLNADGSAFNLSDSWVYWMLVSPDGEEVAELAENISVTTKSPASDGLIEISAPSTFTQGLAPGRYLDAVKVITGGTFTETFWTGVIEVKANLFSAPESV